MRKHCAILRSFGIVAVVNFALLGASLLSNACSSSSAPDNVGATPDAAKGLGDAAVSDAGPTVASDAGDASNLACNANIPFAPIDWRLPTAWGQNACTSQQVAALSQADGTALAAFLGDPSNATCALCISPDYVAVAGGEALPQQRGPLFVAKFDGEYKGFTNFGGCIAHMDGQTAAGSCGNKEQDRAACKYLECGSCVSDSDYSACAASAPACSSYVLEPSCAAEFADGGIADLPCQSLATMIPLWCGPPVDAGK